MANQNESKGKTAAQKMRDHVEEIKKGIKPSQELKDALKKKQPETKTDDNKKVAAPYSPKDEAGL